MKNSFFLGLILMLLGLIGVGIKFNLDLEDSIKVAEVQKIENEKRFEEMEK